MLHPTVWTMWILANWPNEEVMEAAVDEFLLGVGLNPGPTSAHG